jgi:16S rRNA (cytidine1402-2'-O)-methyltransferase
VLYLIATPIGNLSDITLRALEVLRQVEYVASEDTRRTGLLLKHFEIEKKHHIAFYEHNEDRAGKRIVQLVAEGWPVALVTGAGTPGISDPGYTIVRRVVEAGLPVTMVPGPSAFVMALVLSGLPAHSFTFRGFPPRRRGKRRRFLEIDRESPHTLVYYESPHRLRGFLEDAVHVLGDRRAALANELTKMFESVWRGRLSELVERLEEAEVRGEYTVVIAGAGD